MRKIWTRLAATPIGELITGSAYEAHPMDLTAPLGKRFAGKHIIAIFVALEKAATMRVSFDAEGAAELGAVRNIKKRTTPEFAKVVSEEAKAVGAEWCVVIMQTGWQAVLGQRAARPETGEVAIENATPFYRHKLMFDTPEVVVPRAEYSRAHTAVDHPELDRSVVFSIRRQEIENTMADIRGCGLGVAGVKIGVAAQLELWLGTQRDKGLANDLLVTDGLSSLLLNVDTRSQNFVASRGTEGVEMPRQAVARPNALIEDIARHLEANDKGGARTAVFVGPEETCRLVKEKAPTAEIARVATSPAHVMESAVFAPQVMHDLNFDAKDVRPALPTRARRFVIGYAVLLGAAVLTGTFNTFHALKTVYMIGQTEREQTRRDDQDGQARTSISNMAADFAAESALKDWLAANIHAQRVCYELIRVVPDNVTLDRLQLEAKDGQMTLTIIALGDNDALLKAVQAVEAKLIELKYKIGGLEAPVAVGGSTRGVQYRMHIIVPDVGEVP